MIVLDTSVVIEDLLIAATALVRRCPLHTLNRRHYRRISSLRLHEWAAA